MLSGSCAKGSELGVHRSSGPAIRPRSRSLSPIAFDHRLSQIPLDSGPLLATAASDRGLLGLLVLLLLILLLARCLLAACCLLPFVARHDTARQGTAQHG